MHRTIDDLLPLVPEGGSRIFKARVPGVVESRFFVVAFNHDYGGSFFWKNKPGIREHPWTGTRDVPRKGLDALAAPDVTFSCKANKLVDFYSTGSAAYAISNRLRDLIEDLDPGSLEVLPITVKAKDGEVEYNFAMPSRLLRSVEPDLCDIQIVDEKLGSRWIRKVKYPNPNGAVIDPELDPDIHTFADVDVVNRWLWSRQLIDAGKQAGIKGVYTRVPESYPAIIADYL